MLLRLGRILLSTLILIPSCKMAGYFFDRPCIPSQVQIFYLFMFCAILNIHYI